MANALITPTMIVRELARLHPGGVYRITDYSEGSFVIEGPNDSDVRFRADDLLLSLDDFSGHILMPLVMAATAGPRPKPVLDPRYEPFLQDAPPEQVRGSTHGDYSQMASVIQAIKTVMHTAPGWSASALSAGQMEALDQIATKIGRIVCGDPNHIDHWADISGYASLAKDRIARKHA